MFIKNVFNSKFTPLGFYLFRVVLVIMQIIKMETYVTVENNPNSLTKYSHIISISP